MRIAFFGTPDVAATALQALLAAEDVEVAAVVTNPDRPRGRSGRPVPPPVKEVATVVGVSVWQPVKVREVRDQLADLAVDCCAVVAYGALLPADVLGVGGAGFVNLHFSLLPRWRGAAPVQHALRAGDTETGVTTFVIDEGMDTGPILRQQSVPIAPDEDAGQLLARLAEIGAPVLVASLRDLVGGVRPEPQPTDGITMAPKVTADDLIVDWTSPALDVANLVRSASPQPGAVTEDDGARFKIYRAEVVDLDGDGEPGTLVRLDSRGPVVACGNGAVLLLEVQPAGKARMAGAAWAHGYRPSIGHRFGE